ncbi:hypothetical protein SDC9_90378 [bioreactor metagenome]|uniref:Uncharacterized protein n=1 Tax=bioreactor metagenome TaxID=1076179 RepID=A0A644ZUZ6_9ZZZZ|nr:hypothetical protein [Oscillibacter sp.]
MIADVFTQLINPSVDAYNYETGVFLGEARFTPTLEAEKALLDWMNYGIKPKSLLMLESNFEPSEQYTPITPNQTYHQKGIFRALVKDGSSGRWFPVEARITYDWRTRSVEPGLHFNSVEFDNIQILELIESVY